MTPKRLLIAVLSLLMTLAVMAVPARRDRVTYTQPDGSEVTLRLIGDEYGHFFLTDDNRMVVEDASGAFYFAVVNSEGRLRPSTVLASDPADRTPEQIAFLNSIDQKELLSTAGNRAGAMRRAKSSKNPAKTPAKAASTLPQAGVGLFPNTSFPHTGNGKGLVILVQYSDVSFSNSNPATYFSNLLNQEGFSQDNATGSARDYFMASSNGAYTPSFDVYGPVTLPNNRAYYGANDANGNDIAPEDMVVHACQQLNSTINFADYDTDNDGYVDFVYIIYAGLGEANGGVANTVWPHSWELKSAGKMYSLGRLDGKYVNKYACSAEQGKSGSKTINSGIGTFVHEFSHVMGLPDLYATDYGDADDVNPGDWSLMASGSYNNNERTPPTYSIFERNAMGWADVKLLESGKNETVALNHILTSNMGCMVATSSNNEFFLIENRQKTGWDKYLPHHGMLIWHIDYDATVWNNNAPNNDATHQRVDIEEANNRPGTESGYTFPGTSGKTSFTDTTTPNMKTWAGTSLNTPITNIRESNGIVTFDVCGGATVVLPPTANVTGDHVVLDNDFQLVLTPANAGDAIHYEYVAINSNTSFDGIYNGPLTISEEGIIDFWSEREGIQSELVEISFSFKATTPVITPASGSFTAMPEVSITSATNGAEIRYTIDGTAPTAQSILYTAPFTPEAGDITIKAIALKNGYADSEIAQVEYTYVTPHSGVVTYDLLRLWNQEGQSNWSTSYSSRTINSTEATIQMTANHPANDQPITDYPVTKGSDITITMNSGYAPVKGVYLKGCQWNDKTQTISLQYSTDGSRFTTIEGVESSEFELLCNDIPACAMAVRFKFNSSSQIGLQQIIVSYGNEGQPIVIGNPDPDPEPDPEPDPDPNPDPNPNPDPDPQPVDGYTIVFKDNGNDDNTPFSSSNHYEAAVESGLKYASYTTASKAYKGASGLKLGSGSGAGSITLTVNEDYVGKVSSVVINAKKYGNDTPALKFNGTQGDALTAEFADYTWSLNDTELTQIVVETTQKRAYIHSITVVYTAEDPGSDPDPDPDPDQPGQEAPEAPVFKYNNEVVDGTEITVNVLDDIEIFAEEGTTLTVTEDANIDFDIEDNYALVNVLGSCTITATATRGELSTSATITIHVNPIEDAIFTIGEDTVVTGSVEVAADDFITVTAPANASVISVVSDPEENIGAVEVDGSYLVSVSGSCTITATVLKGNVTSETSLVVTVTAGEEPDPEDPEDPQEPTVVERHFSIVYVNATSDSGQDLTATSYENVVEEGLEYASFNSCDKVYDGKTGLKFSSSKANGYLILDFNEGYVKPVTKIEINAIGSDSSAKLNVNNGTEQSISTDALANYIWTLDGTDLTSLRIDATKRCYVKAITVYYNETTSEEPDVVESDPSSATFDFTVEEDCYGMVLQSSGDTYNDDGYVCKDLESNVLLVINKNGGNGSRWWKGTNSNVLRLYKNATIEVVAPTGYHIYRIRLEGVTTSHWTIDGTSYSDVQINGQEGWFKQGKAQAELALSLPSSKSNTDVQKIHVTIDKIGSGIDAIRVDNDDTVEYYNLQGVRIINPEKGIYIRRVGNTVTKVMIK